MAKYSASQNKAVKAYKERNGWVNLTISMPSEERDFIRSSAAAAGQSIREYILGLAQKEGRP